MHLTAHRDRCVLVTPLRPSIEPSRSVILSPFVSMAFPCHLDRISRFYNSPYVKQVLLGDEMMEGPVRISPSPSSEEEGL